MLGFVDEVGEGGVVVAVVVKFFGDAVVDEVEAGGDVGAFGGDGFHAAVGDGALGGGFHDGFAVGPGVEEVGEVAGDDGAHG